MGKTLKAGDQPDETFEGEATREWGQQSFQVQPGTHTVILDTKYIQQKAIAEFIHEVVARNLPRNLGNMSMREAIAIAVGKFEVPVPMIFAWDPDIITEFDLDDTTLATIVRLRNERKTNAKPSA